MKARELMEELFARADEPVRDTVDTCKGPGTRSARCAGSPPALSPRPR